jgi:hypothetical protein
MIEGVKIWENKIKIQIENDIQREINEENTKFLNDTTRSDPSLTGTDDTNNAIHKKYLKYKLKYLKLKAILK